MLKIFAGNLPEDITDEELKALFEQHGRVRSIELARDVFSGKCKGFGFIQMEGHEARAAMSALNGKILRGNRLKVNEERPRHRSFGGRRR
ncbi:MAG: RNA recognition motif domain-containing protein [Chromatiales bacterium]